MGHFNHADTKAKRDQYAMLRQAVANTVTPPEPTKKKSKPRPEQNGYNKFVRVTMRKKRKTADE